MKSLILAAHIILVVCLSASATLAQAGGGMGTGLGRALMSEKLGLTAEQKEKLACETPGQGRQLAQTFLAERAKLNDMLRNSSSSDEDIYAQMEKVNKLQADWNTHRVEKMLRARKVLTEEQMQKLVDLQKEVPHS